MRRGRWGEVPSSGYCLVARASPPSARVVAEAKTKVSVWKLDLKFSAPLINLPFL